MPDWHAIAGALVAGIVTSISPCPLATNIAAIAFLGRRSGQGRRVAWAGLAYTAGRAVAYTGIAAAIIGGLLSTPAMSEILRTKLSGLVGPLLILTGMVVAGWLPLRLPGSSRLNDWGQKLAQKGLVGEFLLGGVFALSFCPASAALFFGTLLPIAVQSDSPVIVPVLYGLGSAVPVLIAVFLFVRGVEFAARLESMRRIGGHLQTGTGVIMIAAGAWMTLATMLR